MMLPSDRYNASSARGRGKKGIFPIIVFGVVFLALIGAGIWQRETIVSWFISEGTDQQTFITLWDARRYDEIILRTNEILVEDHLDTTALMFSGFAHFYISTDLYTLEEKLPYINRSIALLRKALLRIDSQARGGIEYTLGKAYHFKGRYYADLTIVFLERSIEHGYIGNDTYEYMGLAYTNLGYYDKSAEYFKRSIDLEATDIRYLALSQAYLNANRTDDAEAYLLRTINKTTDPAIEQRSRFLLGKIYLDLDQLTKAEDQYRSILAANPRSADALYYLGEIFLRYGKPIEARAQWREALIVDPSHYGARLRYYK